MLDIAVELAWEHVFGIRPRVVGFAEREAYAASLLLARMEEKSLEPAPVFCGDFRDLDARPLRGFVDLFAAGLPCQPYSTAGKQQGLKDARSWGGGDGPLPHALRIIEETGPAMVCLENVPQWITGGAFLKFGEALSSLGYEIEDPFFARASEVGASHRRERVFLLAHLPGERSKQLLSARSRREGQGAPDAERSDTRVENAAQQYWAQHGCTAPQSGWTGTGMADADVQGQRRERRPGLCDSAPQGEGMAHAGGAGFPQCEQCEQCEQTGADHDGQSTAKFRGSQLAHATYERCDFRTWSRGIERDILPSRPASSRGRTLGCLGGILFAPGPQSGDWAHILATDPHLSPSIEPGVRLLADGVAVALDAFRGDQLRCGGNGVVVGQAAAAFVHLFKRLI